MEWSRGEMAGQGTARRVSAKGRAWCPRSRFRPGRGAKQAPAGGCHEASGRATLDHHGLHGQETRRRRGRTQAGLRFLYDREADILHIDKCPPHAEQESEELGDEVVARINPSTGEVENLEVLFFSTRLLRNELFELPLAAQLRIARRYA